MKTEFEYSCPKCDTIDYFNLYLAKEGEYKNKYFYTCQNNDCQFYLNTNLYTSLDLKYLLSSENYKKDDSENYINAIKIRMPDIITHFIDCSWGAHYMFLYREMIYPHLNNVDILKFVLKYSSVISDEYNNPNGYKMFRDLHSSLMTIKDEKINNFIVEEFGAIGINPTWDLDNKPHPF
tara:strand:- start:705 stop:1241 length:537 start_codon:yes stop_codon:yes gene_type:complete